MGFKRTKRSKMGLVRFAEKYLGRELYEFQKEILLEHWKGNQAPVETVGRNICENVCKLYQEYLKEGGYSK